MGELQSELYGNMSYNTFFEKNKKKKSNPFVMFESIKNLVANDSVRVAEHAVVWYKGKRYEGRYLFDGKVVKVGDIVIKKF